MALIANKGTCTPTRRRLAFTLLELMVVIAILAILAVTIAPHFSSSLQGELLGAASRELLQVMNLASSQAVITNTPHRLRFDLAERRYWIEALGEGADGGRRRFRPVKNLQGVAGQLNERVTLRIRQASEGPRESGAGAPGGRQRAAAPPATILFRPDRTAEAKAILVSDEEGFTVALEVRPNNSRVRLLRVGRKGAPGEGR